MKLVKLMTILLILFCTYLSAEGKILFLKGTPYELGYQHGKELKKEIAYNVKRIIDDKILAHPEHPQIKSFLAQLPKVLEHMPEEYKEELKGLADGSEIAYDKILLLNLFPEMFHCTGLTVKGEATKKRELYHVRVLDYSAGNGLQDTATLMVVQPKGKIPFLNVSYAGFIGSVTGMNAEHIVLGEIGGRGYGQYDGMPMAFLLRSILENAKTLSEIKTLLASTARTCEYFYVFSDGKNGDSLGVYATPNQLEWIEPGTTYALFDAKPAEQKMVLDPSQMVHSTFQTALYKDKKKEQLFGLIHHQPANCLIVIGFSNPQRYPILLQRLQENFGHIGPHELQAMIKAPVAHSGNLHNAIFAPTTLDLWLSHAGPHNEPACDQPYQHYNLQELLKGEGYK